MGFSIISALVENKPGVLFRVSNMFRARNFNIESLSVGPAEVQDLSRITVTIDGDENVTEQLVKQMRKLIDVVEVTRLATDQTVYVELALIKLKALDQTSKTEIVNIAKDFGAKVVDTSKGSIMVEMTDTPDKIDAFQKLVERYGILQLARTGVSALPRGSVYD